MAKSNRQSCPDCNGLHDYFPLAPKQGDGVCGYCQGSGFDPNPLIIECEACGGDTQCKTCGGCGYEYYDEEDDIEDDDDETEEWSYDEIMDEPIATHGNYSTDYSSSYQSSEYSSPSSPSTSSKVNKGFSFNLLNIIGALVAIYLAFVVLTLCYDVVMLIIGGINSMRTK